MDEQKDKKAEEGHLHGPWCWGHHGERHHWHPGFFVLRVLIMMIIIAAAFAIGVKLGELRASMYYSGYGGYGYYPTQSMMGGYGGYGPYGAYPMMRYYGAYGAPAPTSTGQ